MLASPFTEYLFSLRGTTSCWMTSLSSQMSPTRASRMSSSVTIPIVPP